MHACPPTVWRKSSYSGGGNNCVEVAEFVGAVAVRDSKDPDTGPVAMSPAEWGTLVARVKAGEFDL